MMLEIQGRLYVIDAGAPVVDIFAQTDRRVEDIKGVFLSHFHFDHCVGVLQLIDLAINYYRRSEFNLYTPQQHEVQAIKGMIVASGAQCESERVKLLTYNESFVFDDGYVRLVPIQTHHTCNNPGSIIKSYAFYVEAEGRRVLFTNDISMHLMGDDFPKIAYEGHFDLVVTEGAHVTVAELENVVRGIDMEILAVTHVNMETNYEDLKVMQERADYRMILPEDGTEIEIGTTRT